VPVRSLAQDVQLCASLLKSAKTVKAIPRLSFAFIIQPNTHKGRGMGALVSQAITDNKLTME